MVDEVDDGAVVAEEVVDERLALTFKFGRLDGIEVADEMDGCEVDGKLIDDGAVAGVLETAHDDD